MAETALEYREEDGILYPQIGLPEGQDEELARLGKYGRMAMRYLRGNHPDRYRSLYRFGRLAETMAQVEEEANSLKDRLTEQYLAAHRPKNPHSTMELWRIRSQAEMQAEEIVLSRVVNRYH